MAEYLEHIRWRRLPFLDPRRTKTVSFGNSPPLRPSVTDHAADLKTDLDEVIEETSSARQTSGIDPNRLLVLSFDFANVDERLLLEKLGLQVIQEREIKTPIAEPKYAVNLSFANQTALKTFVIDSKKYGISQLEQKRDSSGTVSPTKIDVLLDDLEKAKAFLANQDVVARYSIDKISKQAQKRSSETSFKLLVQFADRNSLLRFQNEFSQYGKQTPLSGALTEKERQRLFDAIDKISTPIADDRVGARLVAEGFPKNQTECYMDVDLWHPGSTALIREAADQFTSLVKAAGGTVTESPWPVGDTLLISRVKGTQATLEALKTYDRVARVDLPPILRGIELAEWASVSAPRILPKIDQNGPLACVVDSGIVAGHPLLSGVVVDERDFDSGEQRVVDQVGHGTHVAGIVVYGDVRECVTSNSWIPKVRLLSAKVMKRIQPPAGPAVAGFADEKRVETQLKDAITAFARQHNCRVFNLSLGNSAYSYGQGSQLPWAYVLDELAKSLDIVIVVAAGNVSLPGIPEATTEPEFQGMVRDQLFSDNHKLIDPATAVMALTVGSLARPSLSHPMQQNPGHRGLLGSPPNQPSPFTRTSIIDSNGDGLRRIIKPELVWYGGNYSVPPSTRQWNTNDPGLGELSLKHDFQSGRLLSSSCGTSFSAPYVTHVAAIVEETLRKQNPDRRISANLIRAMVVHGASASDELTNWLADGFSTTEGEERILRSTGYGIPNLQKACFSEHNRSVLFAEDTLKEDYFHLYEIELPDDFVSTKGLRKFRITLAYDPPVSGTRKEYLSRTMWFDLYRGLSPEEIRKARAAAKDKGKKKAPKVDFKSKQVDFRPPYTTLQWSTIQSATFIGKTNSAFEYRTQPTDPVLMHILVGSISRFETSAVDEQNYALVVSVEHSDSNVKIHLPLRQKNLARIRQNWG